MATIKRYDEIMETALANMIARQDKLTDFNEGSIIHTLLDTMARLMERAYTAIRQGYNEQLKILPYSPFGLSKKEGTYATGEVVFTRSSALSTATTIAKGAIVSGGGLTFTTSEAATIAAGELDSDAVAATCDTVGSAGNVSAGTINAIDSVVSADVASVKNSAAFTGGCDEESDTEFYARFKAYISGLQGTNEYAVKAAALSVEGVKNAALLTHNPPADGTYHFTVYIDDGSGGATDSLIEAVTEAIAGDGTESNPGHVCPGINFRVLAPEKTSVDVTVRLTITALANEEDATADATSVITELVNSKEIGESVLVSELIANLMDIDYVTDVAVSLPSANVTAEDSEVLRLGELSISVVQG